jgi:predicted RecA/RadA family phage recombinase
MKNFVQMDGVITVIAPYAVASGQGVLVGALFGIAAYDAALGAAVEIKREGVFDVSAVTADTAAQGAKIYWDNTARKLTTTVASNTLVGAVTVAKAGADTTARVLLDGGIR